MRSAIEKLCRVAGVQTAMATTEDGVPIACVHRADFDGDSDGIDASQEVGGEDALAALTMGWVNELRLATGLLSWDVPERVVLRCARGAIVLRRMRGAVLMVVLRRGANPEDVRLAMDAAAGRIERSLKPKTSSGTRLSGADIDQPPGALPGCSTSSPDARAAETSCSTHRREDPTEH
ncbi:MAG TPA: roadblock/LC7 domain-containing protein [Planctomycetes bacterium]|nr:roadblock/LC7 domain-containing protein [Planctomycetota bacterium]